MKCEQCNQVPTDGQYIRSRGNTVCLQCFQSGPVAVEAREQIAAMLENAARGLEAQAKRLRLRASDVRKGKDV